MVVKNQPKWATPQRKAKLVELWSIYGNKCLHGHTACQIPAHYIYILPTSLIVSKPVDLPCQDIEGNPIIDNEGEQLYLTVQKPETITIGKPVTSRLYDYITELVVDGWKCEDRETRRLLNELESKALHQLAEPTQPLRGTFSAISRDIWQTQQPLYYVESFGFSAITYRPFAKVRLSSSYMRLHIDIAEALRGISKSRKRKAIRYGKPLPTSTDNHISMLVSKAVIHYLNN